MGRAIWRSRYSAPAPPSEKYGSKASPELINHLLLEPDVTSPEFDALPQAVAAARVDEHNRWLATKLQLEKVPVKLPAPQPFARNPLLDEFHAEQGIEHIRLYVGGGVKWERTPNNIPRISNLSLSRSSYEPDPANPVRVKLYQSQFGGDMTAPLLTESPWVQRFK